MRKMNFTRSLLLGASVAMALGTTATMAMADRYDGVQICRNGLCTRDYDRGWQHDWRHDWHRGWWRADRDDWHRDWHPYQRERVYIVEPGPGSWIEWSRYNRLPRPWPHTHYERLGDRVVLVNDNTLQVLAVMGLVSVLLANN